MKIALIFGLLASVITPCSAAPLDEGAIETISISAQEAIEDERPGILHLKGGFLMRNSDWQLTSAEATVFGSPNKPDRIHLVGSPARFLVNPSEDTAHESIEAVAATVEYIRAGNRLTLSGDARLTLGDEVIRSTRIEYDIDTNRYQAGGADGVSIEVPPSRD